MKAIEGSLATNLEAPYSELFRPPYRHLLVLGLFVATFNQLTGINVVMYYAPLILQQTGVATDSSLLQTALIGLNILIFTMAAMATVDKVGRKPLLIVGSLGMIVFQFMLAAAFHWRGLLGAYLHSGLYRVICVFARYGHLGSSHRNLSQPHSRESPIDRDAHALGLGVHHYADVSAMMKSIGVRHVRLFWCCDGAPTDLRIYAGCRRQEAKAWRKSSRHLTRPPCSYRDQKFAT